MVGWRVVYVVIGLLLSLVLHRLLRGLLARGRRMLVVAAVCIGASYLLALVWTATYNLLRQPIGHFLAGGLRSERAMNALFLGAINDTIILVAWGFVYLGLTHGVALEREHARVDRAERLLAESRLRELRYQLNPHLLFNALNAVSTLIAEGRPEEASRMIARLSDLLRTTLREDAPAIGPLAEELTVVGQYLDVERIRFGERLAVRFDVDEVAYRAAVPSLLLQPLVENAIRHDVATHERSSTVAVTARVADGRLRLSVENSGGVGGAVRGAARGAAGGIGLANLRERLAVLYGADHALRAGARDGGGFGVEIELPFRVAESDAELTNEPGAARATWTGVTRAATA